jgi:hypothetical protein
MTPKEKAIEIRDKYIFTIFQVNENYEDVKNKLLIQAKHFALIAVDEMIEQQQLQFESSLWSCVGYWKEVKHEIEKL